LELLKLLESLVLALALFIVGKRSVSIKSIKIKDPNLGYDFIQSTYLPSTRKAHHSPYGTLDSFNTAFPAAAGQAILGLTDHTACPASAGNA
jgi:hypothetical protein